MRLTMLLKYGARLDHRADKQQVSVLIRASGLIPNCHAATARDVRLQRRLEQRPDADRFTCGCFEARRQDIRRRLGYIGYHPHVEICAFDMMNHVHPLTIGCIRSANLDRSGDGQCGPHSLKSSHPWGGKLIHSFSSLNAFVIRRKLSGG